MTGAELKLLMASYRFRYSSEAQLQGGIAEFLRQQRIEFRAEVRLSPADRIDFMLGNLGVEVKINQPLGQVMRQLHRYAQHADVVELLLITNRCQHARIPPSINRKGVEVLFLGWGMLG